MWGIDGDDNDDDGAGGTATAKHAKHASSYGQQATTSHTASAWDEGHAVDDPVDAATDATFGALDAPAGEEEGEVLSGHLVPGPGLMGQRVELCGLTRAAHLNGTFAIALRYDATSHRYAVRRELSVDVEGAAPLNVKAEHLRAVPRLASLAEVQAMIDGAPPGARLTLPRGAVEAVATSDADAAAPLAAAATPADGRPKSGGGGVGGGNGGAALVIRRAIRLGGMGCRVGGTVLRCSIRVDEDACGDLVEISDVHVGGTVDVAPWDVRSVRLVRLAVTAPPTLDDDEPAVRIDEISTRVPKPAEASGRVLLQDCWVRGGGIGVRIGAVGALLRGCRVQGALAFGVLATARIAIDSCVIGSCAAGGIAARAGVDQHRTASGMNSNRVQRDHNDRGYAGYVDGCMGCVGRCTCAAMYAFAALAGGDQSGIRWRPQGAGKWQMGCQL